MEKSEFKLAVFALIQEEDPEFNPIKKMVNLAKFSEDERVQFNAAKELASYCYPKQRPIDENGNAGGDINVTIIKFGSQPEQDKLTPVNKGMEFFNNVPSIGTVIDVAPIEDNEDEGEND